MDELEADEFYKNSIRRKLNQIHAEYNKTKESLYNTVSSYRNQGITSKYVTRKEIDDILDKIDSLKFEYENLMHELSYKTGSFVDIPFGGNIPNARSSF